jgi:hypothetical protein
VVFVCPDVASGKQAVARRLVDTVAVQRKAAPEQARELSC